MITYLPVLVSVGHLRQTGVNLFTVKYIQYILPKSQEKPYCIKTLGPFFAMYAF